jgi:hypothetical protein
MKGGLPDAKHLFGTVWTIVNTVKVYVVIHLISLTQNWVSVFRVGFWQCRYTNHSFRWARTNLPNHLQAHQRTVRPDTLTA